MKEIIYTLLTLSLITVVTDSTDALFRVIKTGTTAVPEIRYLPDAPETPQNASPAPLRAFRVGVARLVETPLETPQNASTDGSWDLMVERVKGWEGFEETAYLCPAGVLTIGYGHTGSRVNGGTISEAEAEELLRKELRKTRDRVLKIVRVPLSENQVAALTSFTYNCGEGALRKLVGKPGRLNDGNYQSIEEIMPLYRKGGGRVLDGLVKRRAWEVSLWNA